MCLLVSMPPNLGDAHELLFVNELALTMLG